MSDAVIKGVKKTSRSTSSATAAGKGRKLSATKSTNSKLIVKRSSAEKAPVQKAAKPKTVAASPKGKAASKSKQKTSGKSSERKSFAVAVSSSKKNVRQAAAKTTTKKKPLLKVLSGKGATAKASATKASGVFKTTHSSRASTPAPPRQPTRDETAALQAFERARRDFAQGRFEAAGRAFRSLVEQFPGVAEVTARARTYMAVIESRLRTQQALPRDADALYDRGVVELNRGEYVAAQELFERALKREPGAAHIYYGLAASRARLGALAAALQSLGQALNLQPNLRLRAQHDGDLAALRNEPDFEQLVFPTTRS
ncbi:MAG: tetratricopeptide repeat protein [Pyrinomonadaceae bacterium]